MNNKNDKELWLNPVGGLGDMLMASSVLKLVHDKDPSQRFNIARRNRFLPFFKNHPAVAQIGHPPKGSRILKTMYWDDGEEKRFNKEAGPGNDRPFQLLAQKFGLTSPVEEEFYFPGDESLGKILTDLISWKKYNIIISPTSDSMKKNMNPVKWYQLIQELKQIEDVNIMQIGKASDPYIKGAFSLIGITSIGQVIGLLRKSQLLISADNFVMHAAHYTQTPSIILWGPTQSDVFGYPEHIHINEVNNCPFFNPCMGRKGEKEISKYHEPCHLPPEEHCMENISIKEILEAVHKQINTINS